MTRKGQRRSSGRKYSKRAKKGEFAFYVTDSSLEKALMLLGLRTGSLRPSSGVCRLIYNRAEGCSEVILQWLL